MTFPGGNEVIDYFRMEPVLEDMSGPFSEYAYDPRDRPNAFPFPAGYIGHFDHAVAERAPSIKEFLIQPGGTLKDAGGEKIHAGQVLVNVQRDVDKPQTLPGVSQVIPPEKQKREHGVGLDERQAGKI